MLRLRFSLIILEKYKKLSIGSKLNIEYLVIAKTNANIDKLQKKNI